MSTINREQSATHLLADDQSLPGCTRAVAINALAHRGPEECLTYLLGVTDAMTGIGHPNHRAMTALRNSLKTILREPA